MSASKNEYQRLCEEEIKLKNQLKTISENLLVWSRDIIQGRQIASESALKKVSFFLWEGIVCDKDIEILSKIICCAQEENYRGLAQLYDKFTSINRPGPINTHLGYIKRNYESLEQIEEEIEKTLYNDVVDHTIYSL